MAVPDGWFSSATTCIALAGTKYSGKSVYIGVAVKQLEMLARKLGGFLTAFDSDTQRAYEELYERAIFRERGILESTPPTDERYNVPLSYVLSVNGRTHVVVLRDIAGEHLQSNLGTELFSFFPRADGVIYLVDPLQIDRVRHQVQPRIALDRGDDFVDPIPVLRNLTDLLRKGLPQGGRAHTRMAMTLSKFDALHKLGEIEESPYRDIWRVPGAAIQRDPSLLAGGFDQRDSDLLNLEVESLLLEVGADVLVRLVQSSYDNWRWFASSAMGHQPKPERQQLTGITPFRCVDPIKWILYENGFLPAVHA